MATNGGISCTIAQDHIRLAEHASGFDNDYRDRYVKFTSGNCTGRWTKINNFVGPGVRSVRITEGTGLNTTVKLSNITADSSMYTELAPCKSGEHAAVPFAPVSDLPSTQI